MEYIVQKGDTPLKIASRFGVGVTGILAVNPDIIAPEYLIPGQIIEIPEASVKYAAQEGDTLRTISEKFGVTIEEIQRANVLSEEEISIKPGQVFCIPRKRREGIVQTNQEYTYDNLVEDLITLAGRYPFIHLEVIGKTVLGKSIYAVRLGKGSKEVFYSAAWHANEWITSPVLMKFIEDFADAFSKGNSLRGYDVTSLFHAFSIWLVPMVNPDGIELVVEGITPCHPLYERVMKINNGSPFFRQWTANVRGVDLNHQWPAQWEEEAQTSPETYAPRHYGGAFPLSEPETKAVYEFTKRHDFLTVLAYHSQGQVIYWGFGAANPEASEKIVTRMQVLSTYTPVHTADSSAGYKDWFIQEYRRPGYTIEVGVGVNPLPVEQFDTIYNQNLPVLLETPLLVEKYKG
jgi:g-D-glutamyl-meso-diaminopimelate peptidase